MVLVWRNDRNEPGTTLSKWQRRAKRCRRRVERPQTSGHSFFSFLSFGPRSSFEGRSESFGKERSIWNDLRTRPERGKGWGKSGLISPIERHHSCIILLSFCSFYYHSTDFSDGLLDPLANVLLHVLILVHHWHRHLSWIKRRLKNIDEDI